MDEDEHGVDQGEEAEEGVEDGIDEAEHGENVAEFFEDHAEEKLTSTPGNTVPVADDEHIPIDINRFRNMFLK
jgi:hypothetical protein